MRDSYKNDILNIFEKLQRMLLPSELEILKDILNENYYDNPGQQYLLELIEKDLRGSK